MRILTVVAPGGGEMRESVSLAVNAWTRGLDIRLRFLNIGLEETVLVLPSGRGPAEPAAAGLEAVEQAISRLRPGAVLLHGGGPAALAAAVTAAKAGVPVVRTGAGRRDGPDGDAERAADRLATVRASADAAALAVLRDEGLDGTEGSPEEVVKALVRVVREM